MIGLRKSSLACHARISSLVPLLWLLCLPFRVEENHPVSVDSERLKNTRKTDELEQMLKKDNAESSST